MPSSLAGPKGTRDLYPADLLRQRYLTRVWRDVSVRHGFEEIDGPTFETADLYAVKSGEGILGELFQAFSGKSPDEVARVRETGRADFALRPEFTPTLARMYAARARQLPQPCRWFMVGPFFRAERPQRGRLREFLQWNADVLGLAADAPPADSTQADAEIIALAVASLDALGLRPRDAYVALNDRHAVSRTLGAAGIGPSHEAAALALLDKRGKLDAAALAAAARDAGLPDTAIPLITGEADLATHDAWDAAQVNELAERTPGGWARLDTSIVRGLAYYTGTVFELIAEGERAIAGGGRYDNLIELVGGPPTPAVGFAMGDVVLGILLAEKGLLPEGRELLDALSRPGPSLRPDVFVISADDEATDPLCARLLADLRRGVESEAWLARDDRRPWDGDRHAARSGGVLPLHARASDKATRNLKKLLADGERQHARFAAVVHGPDRVQLKDMDRRLDLTPRDVPGLPDDVAEFSAAQGSPVYVGRAVAALAAAGTQSGP